MSPWMTRRGLLAASTGTVVFAGCSGTGRSGSPTADSTTAGAMDLDLREANVTAVSVDATDGRYRFDVTLHHDDDGEDGYANWWQVERPDGTTIGRRTLLHPHSSEPFTRSDSYSVPDDVTCVVVRGHDQTHGYGGQAVLVNVESGATRPIQQGADRQSLTEADCP